MAYQAAVATPRNAMPKLLFLILIFSILGCASAVKEPPDKPYAYDFDDPIGPQFESIKLVDEIDAREADILATLYFLRYDGLCGFNSPVTRRGRYWHATTIVGYGAKSAPDITIDTRTGVVRQKGTPNSIPPWTDLREMVRVLNKESN